MIWTHATVGTLRGTKATQDKIQHELKKKRNMKERFNVKTQ